MLRDSQGTALMRKLLQVSPLKSTVTPKTSRLYQKELVQQVAREAVLHPQRFPGPRWSWAAWSDPRAALLWGAWTRELLRSLLTWIILWAIIFSISFGWIFFKFKINCKISACLIFSMGRLHWMCREKSMWQMGKERVKQFTGLEWLISTC